MTRKQQKPYAFHFGRYHSALSGTWINRQSPKLELGNKENKMDAVTVIDRIQFNDHASIYRLSNGLIIHRENLSGRGSKYQLCVPGASPKGAALTIGGYKTLAEAMRHAEETTNV